MFGLSGTFRLTEFVNIRIVAFTRDFYSHNEVTLNVASRIIIIVRTIGFALIWHSYWVLVIGILVNRLAGLVQSYALRPYRPGLSLRSWRSMVKFSFGTGLHWMLVQVRDRGNTAIIGRIL